MLLAALRPYQEEAVSKALEHDGFAIVPEPRTGKTLVALAVIDRRRPDFVLVAAPLNAVGEWHRQWKKFFRSDWPLASEILNYEQVWIQRKRIRTELKRRIATGEKILLIADESHRLKRRGSRASRAMRQLGKKYSHYRLALTGTPIANGLQDAWAQFDFIDPEIFGPWDQFESEHLVYGGYKRYQITGYRNREAFERKFHSRSFRMTLNESRKAPVRVHRIRRTFWLSSKPAEIYRELRIDLISTVNSRLVKPKNVLAAVLKCQQVCGGYVLADGGGLVPVGTEKLDALYSLLIGPLRGKRIVIVSRFLHELDAIEGMLRKVGRSFKRVAGGQPYDGKFDVDTITLQIQSGTSVDMSEADSIVFYSLDYSFINYEQSRFRIIDFHKAWITYYYLLAKDTVDEQIFEAITRKKDLATLVCDTYRVRSRIDEQPGKANRTGKAGSGCSRP